MILRIAPYVLIFTIIVSWTAAAEEHQIKSNSEKQALIEKLVVPWNSVNRILFEYEIVDKNFPDQTIHETMALSSQGSLYKSKAKSTTEVPWQADPFRQEYFIDHGVSCSRFPFKRAYVESSLSAGQELSGSTWEDVLLRILPRWPLTQYKIPLLDTVNTSPILIEALNSDECSVLTNSEVINGRDCVLFDSRGIKRSWVAANFGLCLMQEEIQDPGSGRLLQKIVTDRIEEVAPMMWIPTKYRIQTFREGARTNEALVEREIEISILRCRINDSVSDSIFIPVHPAGSIKLDESSGRGIQMTPGGEELLSDVINFMGKYAHLPSKKVPSAHYWIWFLAGIVGGLTVVATRRIASLRKR